MIGPMMTEDMGIMELWEEQVATAELAQEAQRSDLVPSGKYPFSATAVTKDEQRELYDNGDKNPLYGQVVGRVEVVLHGVGPKGYDPLDGRDRKWGFRVCNANIKRPTRSGERLHPACKIAGDLIGVAEGQGKPFSVVLRWFIDNPKQAQISIGQFTTASGDIVNVVNKVSELP